MGKDEGLQALGSAIATKKALLEFACGSAAERVKFTALFQPSLREAYDEPAKEAQGKGRLGMTNPTVIFAQGYVQSVVQAAFDNPIAPLEFEQASGIQLCQGETADEINGFSGFLALAADASPKPGNGLNSGEAHLLRGNFLAIQHPDFASPPVVLAGHRVGLRRGLRGKNAAW